MNFSLRLRNQDESPPDSHTSSPSHSGMENSVRPVYLSHLFAEPWIFQVPDEVIAQILRIVPMQDLNALQAAAPQLEGMVTRHFASRFRNIVANVFSLEPLRLLSEIGSCHAIIGGDLPLAVLSNGTTLPDRLDIFTPTGRIPGLENCGFKIGIVSRVKGAGAIAQTLGYRDFGTSVDRLTSMTTASGKTIHIIECSQPPVAVLTTVPSTLLMNFVTGDAIYSLYPWQLSRGVGFLTAPTRRRAVGDPQPTPIPVVAELESRGYTHPPTSIKTIGRHWCAMSVECPLRPGRFPSKWNTRIDLRSALGLPVDDSQGVEVAPAEWQLRSDGCLTHTPCDGWRGPAP